MALAFNMQFYFMIIYYLELDNDIHVHDPYLKWSNFNSKVWTFIMGMLSF